MKKVSVMLLLSTALLLSACSNNKKAESTDTTSNQETKISKTKETTETSSSTSKSTSKTDSSSTVTSSNQATAEPSPTVISSSQEIQTAPQEETYEQMKQRTLQSTPADRANWSNKEWEAFGVALYENGLTTDDAGNIISQDQKEQQAASQQNPEAQQTSAQQDADTLSLTDFVNKYGMSPVAWKVQNGMSEEEALRTTQQKTSGEVQLGFSKYGIQ